MKKTTRGTAPKKSPPKASPKAAQPVRARIATKPVSPPRHAAMNRPSTKPGQPKLPPRVAAKLIAPKPTNGAPKVNGASKPQLPAAASADLKPANGNGIGMAKPPAAPRPTAAVVSKPAARVEPVIPPEKDLSTKHKTGTIKDRLVLMVPDPHWLHAVWELSYTSVLRAEAALGQDWHGAKPTLRLFDVTSTDTTSTSEAPIRDMSIHGGCSHWYIDVPQPPRSYRVDVGYLSRRGQFYVLARSNVVTPPKAGASEPVDENWVAGIEKAGGAERVLAMSTGFETTSGPSQLKEFFSEQFKKPAKEGSFGGGAVPGKLKKFHFHIDAELIVFGRTDANATVTLQNEKVPLRPDGTFTMRFSLPDSRQIIPAVATSADGLEEQTIVLAVERNIKRLDPMTHDMYTEG